MKILTGVVVACLGMLAIAWAAAVYLGQVRDRGRDIESRGVNTLIRVEAIRRAYLQVRLDALADDTLARSDDDAEHRAYLKDVQDLESAVTALSQQPLTAAQREVLSDLEQTWRQYIDVVGGDLLAAARRGDRAEYLKIRNGTVKPYAARIQKDLDALTASVTTHVQALVEANEATYTDGIRTVLAVLTVAIAAAVSIASVTVRRLVRPLRQVRDVCTAIAGGDLTQRLDLSGRDEIAQTARALDVATGNTRQTVQALASPPPPWPVPPRS